MATVNTKKQMVSANNVLMGITGGIGYFVSSTMLYAKTNDAILIFIPQWTTLLFHLYPRSGLYESVIWTTTVSLYHSIIAYGITKLTNYPFKYTLFLTSCAVFPMVTHRHYFGLNRVPTDKDIIFKIYDKICWNYISLYALNITHRMSFNKSLEYGIFPPSLNIINDHIALGRMPYSEEIEIIKDEPYNIRCIFNMCIEANGPIDKYKQFDIKYYNFGVMDDTPPRDEDVFKCIELIDEFIKTKDNDSNKTDRILVHCTFGKGRSATIVLSWLISTGMSLNEAFTFLKQKRCHVSSSILHYPVLTKVASKYSQ